MYNDTEIKRELQEMMKKSNGKNDLLEAVRNMPFDELGLTPENQEKLLSLIAKPKENLPK